MYQQNISVENLKKLCNPDYAMYGYSTYINHLAGRLGIRIAGYAAPETLKFWDGRTEALQNMAIYTDIANSRNFKGYILDILLTGNKILFLLNDIEDDPRKAFNVKMGGHTRYGGREITVSELCFIARYWDVKDNHDKRIVGDNILFLFYDKRADTFIIDKAPWEQAKYPKWKEYYGFNNTRGKRTERRTFFHKMFCTMNI